MSDSGNIENKKKSRDSEGQGVHASLPFGKVRSKIDRKKQPMPSKMHQMLPNERNLEIPRN